MAQVKRYPFSMAKHAHDIELYRNRTYILRREAEDAGDVEKIDKYTDLHEEATRILLAVLDNSRDGRVSWLTGKDYGKAKEIVFWAAEYRGR